ncbi:eukaryotic translation initiation factor 3 subunit A [Geranomyces variabilis]|nr:eukaryotic translation initiation factor 3 subunit A [Geranomyces variabilis]
MSRFYNRPENALKRAEELITVSQPASALTLLHEIVMSKRSRSTPLTILEPIMLKFVELCVELRKGKAAKEGLHQYKNISQNITVSSIESVIKRFIEFSEAKVADAQAKADKISVDSVEDLEASETPESIILSTVSAEVDKDRTDREVVTPWLKFLWEAYRTALDILRNNARLEILYQSVANQAFQFCLRYARKTEFRRLCELLRQHLATAAKYAHQAHAINLNEVDTLQRHLDTRFVQLNAATELQLWQEAFRSVEDIHNLLGMAKKAPKPFMMANYYEKLSKIFLVGENYLFHAAAWNKLYATVRLNKNLGEEEHNRMASMVLMSALAIPIITTSKTRAADNDDNKPKNARLANLLRVNRAPTRESLLKDALSKVVFSRVRPELKELYQILEVQFHPLSITKKIAHLLPKLQADKDLKTYVAPLHQVILTRLLQQLSQVYTTVKIESVVKLAAFPEPFNYSAHHIEKFIMNGCKKGELSIRVNHQSQTLTFETDVFSASKVTVSEGPQLQSLPSEQMRTQLTRLAKRLHTAVALIGQTSETLPVEERLAQVKKEAKAKAFAEALARLEEERKQNLQRSLLIQKKKELRENELAKQEKVEAEARKKRAEAEAESEKIRLEEDAKKREADRLNQQLVDIKREEAGKLAAKLAEDLKNKNVKVNTEELEGMDTARLMQLQVEQLEKEKRELQTRLKTMSKKFDHTERAMRKAEIPLLDKDYDEQKAGDRAAHEILTRARLAEAKMQHEQAIVLKGRMMRMLGDYTALKAEMAAKREAEYEAIRAESERRITEAKERRIEEYKQAREEERRRREREEEERIEREEEDRRRTEREDKEAEEAEQRREAQRLADEERLAKLDEISRKTRERELAVEAKLEAERQALAAAVARPSVAAAAPAQADAWRRAERPAAAAPVAAAIGSGAPGKYVPPVRRTDSAGGDGWRSRASQDSVNPSPPGSGFGSRESLRSDGGESAGRPSWGSSRGAGGLASREGSGAGAAASPREERTAGAWKPAGGAPGGGSTWRDRQREAAAGGDAAGAAAPGTPGAPGARAGPPTIGSGKWTSSRGR